MVAYYGRYLVMFFYAMANNEGIKNVFNGDKNSKVPAFSNELVVNGCLKWWVK